MRVVVGGQHPVPGRWISCLNYFLPTMKLEKKERVGSRTVRHYGPTRTPPARVLAGAEVPAETKAWLQQEQATLNPFAVRGEVERQLKLIEAGRRQAAP